VQPEKTGAAKIEDILSLDYRTGSIYNKMTEARVQVIPILRWRKLKDNLMREFRHKAPPIMSLVGSTLGASVAEEMMAKISEPEALVRYLSDMLASLGWGVFSMVGDTRYGSRFVVSVANCGFCDKEDLSDSPQCDFLVAALKGMADTVYGTPHRVREERCAAKGDSVCQFEVEECDQFQFCTECNNWKFCDFARVHGNRITGRGEFRKRLRH
jgi:predicted hydrocarbon binding protein